MTASPPCLPPISGVLVMANPEVVRPVAFRAVQQRDGSSTPLEGSIPDEPSSTSSVVSFPEPGCALPGAGTDAYFSGHHSAPLLEQHQRVPHAHGERPPDRCRRTSFYPRRSVPLYHNSVPSLDRISFHQSVPHFGSHGGNLHKTADRGSHSSSGSGVHSEQVLDSGHSSALLPDEAPRTPPSPSDSGIAELEAQLREKDAEIARLRQTLEQNEQAIIRVYEEKEESWKTEMENLRRRYEELTAQHRLQTETNQGHPSSSPPRETFSDRPEPWEPPEPPRLDVRVSRLAALVEDTLVSEDARYLRQALQHCQQQLHAAVQSFRKERSCWLQEKAQVLQYQRQLELSYWQTCNHNRELLRAVARVSVPLEALDGWYHSESSC